MTDRFRTTFPIRISFADGEEPSAAKVSAIASQAKAGLGLLEKAVGDIWGQSGDPVLVDYPLQIVNLARVLGEQWRANGMFLTPDFTGSDLIVVQETITTQVGQPELLLNFQPDSGSNTTMVASLATFGYTSAAGTRAGLNAANKYFVDATNHKILLGSPLSNASSFFSYEVDQNDFPAASDLYAEEGVNVIPDPRTVSDGWEGLKFYKVSANKYLMFLPPRCPTSVVVGKVPLNTAGNRASDATTLKYYFPLGSDFAGLSAPVRTALSKMQQYRYRFPEEIRSLISDAGESGTRLPAGLLYLWDNDSNSIIEGITYRVPETNPAYSSTVTPRPKWVIQIEGPTLDALLSSYHETTITSDLVGHYKNRFSLITVGNSVAKTVANIAFDQMAHNHSAGLATRVSHGDLLNLDPADGTPLTTGRADLGAPYTAGDDHAQYLSRFGSTATEANQRDRYNNGMLGDLLISSTGSANNYQNLSSVSNKIWFGAVASGIAISRTASGFFIEGGNLVVDQSATIDGSLVTGTTITAGTDILVGDDLVVTDDATVLGDLSVSGVATIRGDITGLGSASITNAVITDTVSSSVTTASSEFIGPNAPKAWGIIRSAGDGSTTASVLEGYNIASAAATTTGFTVVFTSSLATPGYCVIASVTQASISGEIITVSIPYSSRLTTGFTVNTTDITVSPAIGSYNTRNNVTIIDFVVYDL